MRLVSLALRCGALLVIAASAAMAQVPAATATVAVPAAPQRLILKDGSYQVATKWEVKADRVRYYSSERAEWEELPNDLVDWDATNRYEEDRRKATPAAEAIQLDKEEAAAENDDIRAPKVAEGLRLPPSGGVFVVDAYKGEPQLLELTQTGGEVNRNLKGNILRAAVNPLASNKQTIELPGLHAAIQSHVVTPSLFINIEGDGNGLAAAEAAAGLNTHNQPQQPQSAQQPEQPLDRFRIVKLKSKKETRVVGTLNLAIYGKLSQSESFVPADSKEMGGGWTKVTPLKPLEPGEYAIVETLGDKEVNLYVWDFGINPAAGENKAAWRPVDADGTNRTGRTTTIVPTSTVPTSTVKH